MKLFQFLTIFAVALLAGCNGAATTNDSPSADSGDVETPATNVSNADDPEEELSLETVLSEIASGDAILIDVREQGEYDTKHFKAATLIPKSGIDAEGGIGDLDKSKRIYTHCAAGRRATAVAEMLKKQGYNVVALKYSYDELAENGFEQGD